MGEKVAMCNQGPEKKPCTTIASVAGRSSVTFLRCGLMAPHSTDHHDPVVGVFWRLAHIPDHKPHVWNSQRQVSNETRTQV